MSLLDVLNPDFARAFYDRLEEGRKRDRREYMRAYMKIWRANNRERRNQIERDSRRRRQGKAQDVSQAE
jgi:hypothetical protein